MKWDVDQWLAPPSCPFHLLCSLFLHSILPGTEETLKYLLNINEAELLDLYASRLLPTLPSILEPNCVQGSRAGA